MRNILLAEPLVGDFGKCFAGVSPEQAEVLAGSFAIEQCARREELATALREHLTGIFGENAGLGDC